MRIESWNPNKFDETFEDVAIDKLVECGKVIAAKAKSKVPNKLNLSRPVYKTGKHAGKIWTSRDAGRLKISLRWSRKKTKSGKAFSRKRNVRVYAGHFTAYYPYWVEFGTSKYPDKAFLRPAFYSSISEMKAITGAR